MFLTSALTMLVVSNSQNFMIRQSMIKKIYLENKNQTDVDCGLESMEVFRESVADT